MTKRKTLASLMPCILLGFLALSLGCGRAWSVKGSSFPQETPAERSVSVADEEKMRQSSTPYPPPQTEGEADEISRRAEELRRDAEKLALEAASLGRGERRDASERGPISPGGEKMVPEVEPGLAETSGGLRPTQDLHDVFFDFDQYLLSEEALGILQKNAEWLRSHAQARILIEGHCDERGTVEYNLALGERRAQSVKDYLLNLGVAPDRISTISYGKEKPFALGRNEEAWAQNRRAHFLLRSP